MKFYKLDIDSTADFRTKINALIVKLLNIAYTHTLYGSRGSDVRVILNVTLDLMEKKRKYVIRIQGRLYL